MSRIVVTGAAGFIGSNFTRYVLNNTEHSVVGIDSLTYASNLYSLSDLPDQRFHLAVGDIRDRGFLERILNKDDLVVNFAAESHNDNSLAEPAEFVSTNVSGTFNLLEVCRKLNLRFHHISTDEVFGDLPLSGGQKFSENSPYAPSSPYSASKAAADHLVRAWVRSYGLRATISNCSNNYGPRQHVEKFIPRQVTNLLLGRKAVLYGLGCNVRDWIHVDDHSSAVLKILLDGKLGETYLIGADGELSNREVLEAILDILNGNWDDVDHAADRPGHDLRYAINFSKLSNELDWHPVKTDFRQGLAETINWYRENQSWWTSSKVATERRYVAQKEVN